MDERKHLSQIKSIKSKQISVFRWFQSARAAERENSHVYAAFNDLSESKWLMTQIYFTLVTADQEMCRILNISFKVLTQLYIVSLPSFLANSSLSP